MGQTIQEYMKQVYGNPNAFNDIVKGDTNLAAGTTGARNVIFGAKAFSQFNDEAQTWNVLPKVPWQKSGFRVRTGRGFTVGTYFGSTSDGGTIGDTLLSTIATATVTAKLSRTAFGVNLGFSLQNGDDNYTYEEERTQKAVDHIKDINAQLHLDANTLSGNNFESIDRVCSSQSEESALLTAADADIYGFDRSASTAYDAYVDHASGVDRVLTEELLRTAVESIMENSGKKPNVIITGYDTARVIDRILGDQLRYDLQRVSFTINGIKTVQGNDAGFQTASYYGIPIIRDSAVQKDSISRIYFLNTDFLKIAVLLPTQLYESTNYVDRNEFINKGVYLTIGELWCENFSAQGKIRDLKAS